MGLITLKEGKHENMISCSKKIIGAVRDLTLLFPENSGHPVVSEHISALRTAAHEYRVLILQCPSQTPTTEVLHPWNCWSAPSTSPSQLANSRSTSDDSFTTTKSVIPLFILHAFTYF